MAFLLVPEAAAINPTSSELEIQSSAQIFLPGGDFFLNGTVNIAPGANVTIIGAGTQETRIDAQSVSRHFDVFGILRLVNLQLMYGNSGQSPGGSIYVPPAGAILMEQTNISLSSTLGNGGALACDPTSSVTLISSTLYKTSAEGQGEGGLGGGAFFAVFASVTLIDTLLVDVRTSNTAGAFAGLSSTIVMQRSIIRNAYASIGSGAVLFIPVPDLPLPTCILEDSLIESPIAGIGAAIGGVVAPVTIQRTVMRGGRVTADAGGLALGPGADLVLIDTQISDCTAPSNGGTINAISGSRATLIRTIIFKCTVGNRGGALYISGGTVSMSDSSILDCIAGTGGAVLLEGGSLHMTTSNITQCQTTTSGGGIRVIAGSLKMEASIIDNCTASSDDVGVSSDGGALYASGSSTVSIINSLITGSRAKTSGGGLYCAGTMTINASRVDGCTATTGGGLYQTAATTVSKTEMRESYIVNCVASNGGGARVDQGTVALHESYIQSCEGLVYGGGIDLREGVVAMSGGGIIACRGRVRTCRSESELQCSPPNKSKPHYTTHPCCPYTDVWWRTVRGFWSVPAFWRGDS